MSGPPVRHTSRRSALFAAVGAALSGCGFRPVYLPAGEGPAPAASLSAIEVKPIYERPGQILRDALKARLASDTGVPHRYDLQVSFWIAGEGIGVLDLTQYTRIRLTGYANWVLMSRDAKPTRLVQGNERVIDGLDQFNDQYFAADLENEHVQRRVADQVAERIALRLAIWFHQHPPVSG